jgi:hypothetical protein
MGKAPSTDESTAVERHQLGLTPSLTAAPQIEWMAHWARRPAHWRTGVVFPHSRVRVAALDYCRQIPSHSGAEARALQTLSRCPRRPRWHGAFGMRRFLLCVTHNWGVAHRRIPKGFRNKAQGCEARATLGHRVGTGLNPNRVVPWPSSEEHNPLGGGTFSDDVSKVARVSQPWAGGPNPFWIGRNPTRTCGKCKG